MKKVLISMLVVVSLLLAVSCSTSYTVAFNTMGGTPETVKSQTVAAGGVASAPTPDPVKYGYKFTGWYTDSSCAYKWDFATKVTANMTLYAGWQSDPESIKYTVHFELNGGSPAVADQVVVNGKYATDPETIVGKITRGKLYLEGWYTTPSFLPGTYWGFETEKVTKDVTLYAKYTNEVPSVYYSVTFKANGGTPNPGTQTILKGQLAQYPTTDPQKDGSIFTGWYTDASCSVKASTVTVSEVKYFSNPVTSDVTYYAGYKDGYLVTFDVADSLMVVPAQEVKEGEGVKVPANPIPAKGYEFKYWYIVEEVEGKEVEIQLTADTSANPEFVNLAVYKNLTIYAKFARIAKVIISFDANGGTPIPSDQVNNSFIENRNYVYAVKPVEGSVVKDGFELDGWYLDKELTVPVVFGISYSQSSELNTTKFYGDATVYAKWTPAVASLFTYNYDNTVITGVVAGDLAEDTKVLRIPEGVKAINCSLNFTHKADVQYVQIPSTLTELNGEAVYNPNGDGLNLGGVFAFWTGLKVISTEAPSPAILKTVVAGTRVLTLEVPEQITKIGPGCFDGCSQIGTLKLGTGVTELPDYLSPSITLSASDAGIMTIYADGATTIGKVFSSCPGGVAETAPVSERTLYARSVKSASELMSLDAATGCGIADRVTVYVNAAYVEKDPFDPASVTTRLAVIRDTSAKVYEVRNAEELVDAVKIEGATVILSAGGEYKFSSTEAVDVNDLHIAKGITLAGTGLIDFSASANDFTCAGLETDTYKGLLKLAEESAIVFKLGTSVTSTKYQNEALWYLAQVEGADIVLGGDYIYSGSTNHKTLTIAKGVEIGSSSTVTLSIAANNNLDGAENLTGVNLTIDAYATSGADVLKEAVKANDVIVKATTGTSANGIEISGNNVTIDLGSSISYISRAIVSGTGLTVKFGTAYTEFEPLLVNSYDLTMDLSGVTSGIVDIADGLATAYKTVTVGGNKTLKGTSYITFGLYTTIKNADKITLKGGVTLYGNNADTIKSLLTVKNANVKLGAPLNSALTSASITSSIYFTDSISVGSSSNNVTLDISKVGNKSNAVPKVAFANGRSFSIVSGSTLLVGQENFGTVLNLGRDGALKLAEDVEMGASSSGSEFFKVVTKTSANIQTPVNFVGTLDLNGHAFKGAFLGEGAVVVGHLDTGAASSEKVAVATSGTAFNSGATCVSGNVTFKNAVIGNVQVGYVLENGGFTSGQTTVQDYKAVSGTARFENCSIGGAVNLGEKATSERYVGVSDAKAVLENGEITGSINFKYQEKETPTFTGTLPQSKTYGSTTMTFKNVIVRGSSTSPYTVFGTGITPSENPETTGTAGYYSVPGGDFSETIVTSGKYAVSGGVGYAYTKNPTSN